MRALFLIDTQEDVFELEQFITLDERLNIDEYDVVSLFDFVGNDKPFEEMWDNIDTDQYDIVVVDYSSLLPYGRGNDETLCSHAEHKIMKYLVPIKKPIIVTTSILFMSSDFIERVYNTDNLHFAVRASELNNIIGEIYGRKNY